MNTCFSPNGMLVLIGAGGIVSFLLGRAEPIILIIIMIFLMNEVILLTIYLMGGLEERREEEGESFFFAIFEVLFSSLHLSHTLFLILCWIFVLIGLYSLLHTSYIDS